jgi:hypothetical protein
MILDGLTIIGVAMALGVIGALVYLCSRDGCGNRQ